MGQSTAIAWTDHTFNPWWGCQRVSPGCEHCYAETFAKRTGHAVWGKTAERRMFGDKHWAEPLRWNAIAEAAGTPAKVFCASMADVFEDRPELVSARQRLFDLIDATPHLIWQLLTKRPQNVFDMAGHWMKNRPNVWLGTTVEDQQRATERIPALFDTPAAVRFLSCEPLLGMVDLTEWLHDSTCWLLDNGDVCTCAEPREEHIDWVICGGESGPGHRALDPEHALSLRDQCSLAGVPFFFKQVGGRTPTVGGDVLDGRQHKEFPS